MVSREPHSRMAAGERRSLSVLVAAASLSVAAGTSLDAERPSLATERPKGAFSGLQGHSAIGERTLYMINGGEKGGLVQTIRV